MTLAICVKCGAEKIGALTPCHSCGFEPLTPEDRANGMLLCDHLMSADDLRAVAAEIKSGEPLNFDKATIADIMETLHDEEKKMPLGCTIAVWTPVVIMLLLLAIVLALLVFIAVNKV